LTNNIIQYTAFLNLIDFSKHLQEEDYFKKFSDIHNYLEEFEFENIYLNYLWVSDTIIINISSDDNIQTILIEKLSSIISFLSHYFITEHQILVQGAISSQHTYINQNLFLGKGIDEAKELASVISTYPRVIFEQSIIDDEISENINLVSQDFDNYYFVDYLLLDVDMKQYEELIENGLFHTDITIKSKYMWLQQYYKSKVFVEEAKIETELEECISTDMLWQDPQTGLIWEREIENREFTWDEVFEYAEMLNDENYGDYQEWRVPTIEELKTLITDDSFENSYSATKESFISEALVSSMTMSEQWFWSSTENSDEKDEACGVLFDNGDDDYFYKSDSYFIRCVLDSKGKK